MKHTGNFFSTGISLLRNIEHMILHGQAFDGGLLRDSNKVGFLAPSLGTYFASLLSPMGQHQSHTWSEVASMEIKANKLSGVEGPVVFTPDPRKGFPYFAVVRLSFSLSFNALAYTVTEARIFILQGFNIFCYV
ncbi:hypothetical protein Pfo_026792 [Paulownia fortunei]|nr:hypothetical protein Pfo_026792 [Paulownia fortunei]